MRVYLLLLASLMLATACGGSSSGPMPMPTLLPVAGDEAIWAPLESRLLNLPRVSPGECPVAGPVLVTSTYGIALEADGPLHPVGMGELSTLNIGGFNTSGDWLGNKILWVGSPDFTGKAIVRGGRLDAPGEVGFGGAIIPDTEMRFESGPEGGLDPGGWYGWPSYTRMKEPGCYAYRVDGDNFSYAIIFQAELAASSAVVADDASLWAALESRPLTLPTVAPGECPVAASHEPLSPGLTRGLGNGPWYPVGMTESGTLLVGKTERGGDWFGERVIWAASPDFTGKALIRGGRLDAPGEVRFGGSLIPDASMIVDTKIPGTHAVTPQGSRLDNWYEWPSYSRVQQPGCYAYQVDTDNATYTIVFRVEASP